MSERSTAAALFVRLPQEQADRLDRAASALGTPKGRLVARLVEQHVDPDTPAGLEELRGLPLGRHAFRPAAAPDVLTAEEAAGLLQAPVEAVVELAEKGELPGRKLAGEWRFAREALIAWLSGR
jgi:excisionase family DNA binding protein